MYRQLERTSAEQHTPTAPTSSAGSRRCLTELSDALHLARDLNLDPWQFALEICELKEYGVRRTDLRWLLAGGLIDHAMETSADSEERRFTGFGGLRFSKKSCFVLTPAGEEYVQELTQIAGENGARQPASKSATRPPTAQTSQSLPHWDTQRRQLLVGTEVVKVFRSPSHNQVRVLAAFQEEGWPTRIDDPLPRKEDVDPKQRLHDTIKGLNRNQLTNLLRFKGDGTGEGVSWEYTG